MIQELKQTTKEKLFLLFQHMDDTVILSCLEEHLGSVYVNNKQNPTAAIIIVGGFVAVAGNMRARGVKQLIRRIPEESIVITESENWKREIKQTYPTYTSKGSRYRFQKNKDDLDPTHLKRITPPLPMGYQLKRIDSKIVKNTSLHELSVDFTGQFKDVNDFLNRGVGFAILYEGTVAAAATSYSIYNEGIEIEIATRSEHRNQGLATIVASSLILYCLDHGLYPSWDAANDASLHLAEKLGYVFKEEYEVLCT